MPALPNRYIWQIGQTAASEGREEALERREGGRKVQEEGMRRAGMMKAVPKKRLNLREGFKQFERATANRTV